MGNAIEKIREELDIKEVCEFYGVEFDNRGFAKCPFHEEKTPSFKTYNGKFKCFGCGKGGSVIDFVMETFGINFSQALVRLGSDFGIDVEPEPNNPIKARERAEQAALVRRYEAHRKELWQSYDTWSKIFRRLFYVWCITKDKELEVALSKLEEKLDMFIPEVFA